MLLSSCANQVLQEFGGAMPDSLISFEDAEREFLNVRALELQKLGISTTDITVSKQVIYPSDRDQLLTSISGVDMIPAFVEVRPRENTNETRYKVEIIPVELIPSYEGSRAIAFYGTPKRYRLAWDAWDDGDMTIFFDPVEDITAISGSSDITFPPNFWPFLYKKTALNLIRVALIKLAIVDPTELRQSKGNVERSLSAFASLLAVQLQEWEEQFKKFKDLDLNAQPHLRRTNDEIRARSYQNVTGFNPLDWEY